jgi:hypothetical protein
MGDTPQLLWLESSWLRGEDYRAGRWDEALERATRFLAKVASVGGHYLEPSVLMASATIHASREDAAAAERDFEASDALIGADSDAQSAVPHCLEGAYVKLLLGDAAGANALLDNAVPIIAESAMRAPGITADNAIAIVRLGRGAEWLELMSDFVETGRVWAARLMYTGRTADAAELYSHIALPEEEAVTRLLAAEQLVDAGRRAEADRQLQRALAFCRAVGATAIMRRAETLLAAAG